MRAIDAGLDDQKVMILDLSKNHAVVEHAFRVDPGVHRLSFDWENERIDLDCRIASSQLQDELSDREQRLIYHSTCVLEGDTAALERACATYAQRLEEAQEANSLGFPEVAEESIDDIGRPLRERRIGYVSCILRDGTWRRVETRSPDQPLYGFTVAAHEPEEQIRLLRLAWEEADAEGRRLLREFAAASIRKSEAPPEGEPPATE